MSVSQSFTPIPEKKKLRVDMSEPVLQELELYLQAAREDYDWLTLDMVVEQLLEDALKKDRAFRTWLKQHRKTSQQQPGEETMGTDDGQPATQDYQLAGPAQQDFPHHHG